MQGWQQFETIRYLAAGVVMLQIAAVESVAGVCVCVCVLILVKCKSWCHVAHSGIKLAMPETSRDLFRCE